jgi:predicted metalloprotease with PDZ domain
VDRDVIVLADDENEIRPRVLAFHREGDAGGFLGVHVEEETEGSEGGAEIVSVVEGSPADRAGLEEGDVIVGIDGDTVRGPMGLRRRLADREPGDSVKVEVRRNGRSRTFETELGEPETFSFHMEDWDSEELEEKMGELGEKLGKLDLRGRHGFPWIGGNRPKLGVELVATTPELREHLGGNREAGVLVGRVMEGMPAARAGLQAGDLITAIDGVSVEDASDLVDGLRDAEGTTISLDVVRDRRERRFEIEIPAREEEDDRYTGPRAGLDLNLELDLDGLERQLVPDLDLDDLERQIRRALEDAQRALEGLGRDVEAAERPAAPARADRAEISLEC